MLGAGLALKAHEDALRERGIGVRLLFQPAEEVIPGGAVDLLAEGALDDVDAIFAVHCDPSLDVGSVGLRDGRDHRCGRPRDRAPQRPGRPHLATAPHRGPHLRARQGGHRAARPCCRAGSTRAPRSRWSGARCTPAGRQRHPVQRHDRRHPADARRHRVDDDRTAPRRGGGAHRRPVCRDGSPRARPGGATRGQRRGGDRGASARPPRGRASRRGDAAVPRRGGLRVVPAQGPGRDGPAGYAHARRAAPTTSTRATCVVDDDSVVQGARLLAGAVVAGVVKTAAGGSDSTAEGQSRIGNGL